MAFRLRLEERVQINEGKVSGRKIVFQAEGPACAKAIENMVLKEEWPEMKLGQWAHPDVGCL